MDAKGGRNSSSIYPIHRGKGRFVLTEKDASNLKLAPLYALNSATSAGHSFFFLSAAPGVWIVQCLWQEWKWRHCYIKNSRLTLKFHFEMKFLVFNSVESVWATKTNVWSFGRKKTVTTGPPTTFLFGLCSVAFIGGLDGFSKLQSFDSTSTKGKVFSVCLYSSLVLMSNEIWIIETVTFFEFKQTSSPTHD